MRFSDFAERFGGGSGILQLMDDIGAALAGGGGGMLLLGGGNPAHLPAVEQALRRAMQAVMEDGDAFERTIGDYDGPRGNEAFIGALAELLRGQLGWPVGAENIAVTNGSQSGFFTLMNLFGGKYTGTGGAARKKILLPLCPEYIGYSELGIGGGELFQANKPRIELLGDGFFKYRVDLARLDLGGDTGALCVSRPTNPTGNVLGDFEMQTLAAAARRAGVPFIVDNAYGLPFPGIVFEPATMHHDGNTITCLSLSKLGLPGARTGIIVAAPEVISRIAAVTASLSLATGSFGQALALELIRGGEILKLSAEEVMPFYRARARRAAGWLRDGFGDLPVLLHKPEGGIFLWLWFQDFPLTSAEFYRRLKEKNVLVVPGEHFFFGLREDWPHRRQCLRLSYAQDEATVQKGIELLTAEARAVYAGR